MSLFTLTVIDRILSMNDFNKSPSCLSETSSAAGDVFTLNYCQSDELKIPCYGYILHFPYYLETLKIISYACQCLNFIFCEYLVCFLFSSVICIFINWQELRVGHN